jgi:phosphoglycolate phosphatase-like HAD superfamily hydrolase
MTAAGTGPDDTIMVGDSAIDLRTARAAGTRICLVRYGFGFRFAAAELAGDELLAGTAGELLALLRQALHLSTA